MLANRRNFEIRTAKYLASEVLTFDNWTDSIGEGHKDDILVLYGLCMMLSKHALVHLHDGVIWTTMDKLG